MKTCVLLYDNFMHFEISIATLLFSREGDVISASLDKKPVRSYEGLTFVPDASITELDEEKVDVLLIPGGNPRPFSKNLPLIGVIRSLNDRGVPIGAICGGSLFLADAKVLENRQCTTSISNESEEFESFKGCELIDSDVVVDKNIVTAQGNAFVEFAMAIANVAHIFKAKAEIEETYLWLKNRDK